MRILSFNAAVKSTQQSPLKHDFLHCDKFICALDGTMNALKRQMINCIFLHSFSPDRHRDFEKSFRMNLRKKLLLFVTITRELFTRKLIFFPEQKSISKFVEN